MMPKPGFAATVLLTASLALAAGACSPGSRGGGEGGPTGDAQATARSATPVSPPERRSAILDEIRALAADYNLLVADEQQRATGTPATQQPGFGWVDLAANALVPAWDSLVAQVQTLNREYFALAAGEFEPPVLPTPALANPDEAETEALLNEAGAEYVRWLEREAETGDFISLLFDPYEGRPQVLLIGDSYVEEQLYWQAVLDYRLALTAPPPAERVQEERVIQAIFPGEVELIDVGVLLPPYTGDTLHEYRAGPWRVIVHPVMRRVLMIDRDTAAGPGAQHSNPDCAPQTADALAQTAVAFAGLAGEQTDLATLSAVFSQKGSNFFFRWEDRTRPLLPDGRSYPFVQVALDACGELLNYYNTLYSA